MMAAYSLAKIITTVSGIQTQLSLDQIRGASRSAGDFLTLQNRIHLQVNRLVEGIERDLSQQHLTAADLAIRSRRGYQWLKFLASPDNLVAHLDTLQRFNLFLGKTRDDKLKQLSISLYHQSALYSIQSKGNQKQLVAQESYLTAPDRILQALLELVLHPASPEAKRVLRKYTSTEEYRRIRTELEYLGVPPGSFSAGEAHHLGDSFQRVNQTYFQGTISRPHLVWSRRLTKRKFGHYQWDTDTVMVSKSLDQKSVPDLVIDFVIFHELLHKKLGVRQAKQNRMAHTQEFKAAESQFVQIEKARKYLNRIAQNRL